MEGLAAYSVLGQCSPAETFSSRAGWAKGHFPRAVEDLGSDPAPSTESP